LNISAAIQNSGQQNKISVQTDGKRPSITVPAKTIGNGSSVNGGELLFLAPATCACNDLYREAFSRKIELDSVSVTVSGRFGQAGETASPISYGVSIQSPHSQDEIDDLVRYVDSIAEIHNTLTKGLSLTLGNA